MYSQYRHPVFRELRDQQLRCAPLERRLAQINRVERLLGELEPTRRYSYPELYYEITRQKTDIHADLRLGGREISHDLRLYVEDLSDSANISAEAAGERVLTVNELAKELNVSAKTIARWRRLGLVSRRFVFQGRKRLGFLQSSIDRFVDRNRLRVLRGAQFSQLTEEERDQIINRGRQLAQAGMCPAAVTKQLAQETGRSAETIRYTLKRYDQERPNEALFPGYHGPMHPEMKLRIYQFYRRGESIAALAQRFYRTKKGIRRLLGEVRAQRILELPLSCIPNPQFDDLHSEKDERDILRPMPRVSEATRFGRAPSGLPAYLASLYRVPLLTREQESHLFRKMNYLKYKASQLRDKLDVNQPKAALMDQIEKCYDDSVVVKNQIIRANLRLVVSIAKRRVGIGENFFELVSDGNMSLIRAVERFDFARGNKFSTYASWAIMKNFARSIPEEHRHRDRFRTSYGEMFTITEDIRSSEFDQESAQSRREAQVERILSELDKREQQIVIRRFGLDRSEDPLTLKQVGALLGVTKERIRQLEARALKKLRKAVENQKIEFSA
jgi:RNA polymerase primary sigma factor/RNA polymerase sigma factor